MGRTQPPRVPTDEVIPALFFDQYKTLRNHVIRWVFCFDDVLDAHKLNTSLTELLEMESWKRLGGRWRFNEQKKLEVHVPRTFDTKRPAVRFSHDSFDVDINEHPLGSRIAQMADPTKGPLILGPPTTGGLGTQDEIPTTFEEYIYNDEPLIALHVVTFRDATILTLNCSHGVMDVVGCSALIQNWCKVLAGREDEVLPLENHDVLATRAAKKPDDEEYALMSNVISGLVSSFLFSVRFVWDMVFGPTMENRMVVLPEQCVQTLKERAVADLRTNRQTDNIDSTPNDPFISEGDILAAWCSKMMASGMGPQCTRSASVSFAFELRNRLSGVFKPSTAYVQNAFIALNTMFTTQDLQELPLGQIALRLRSSMAGQITEPQVRAQLREQIRSIEKSGKKLVHAKTDSVLFSFSNWTKARLFETIDFSSAVVKIGKRPKERISAIGKPALLFPGASNVKQNLTHRNVIVIVGKDREGNCWFTGTLSRATWLKIEEGLKGM